MSIQRLSRRALLNSAALTGAGLALAACQPKVVEKIVEKPVEVIKEVKEVVKETVIVEGTPKVIEKEVTRIATAPPAPKEKVHLRYTVMASPQWNAVAQLCDERFMEAYPYVEVEQMAFPWSGYQDKILTMLAGGDIPDSVRVDGYWLLRWATMDVLRPLDDYIEADNYHRHKVIPGMWPVPDHHAAFGKIYSLVTVEGPRTVYFNETAFKEAGLKTPIELVEEGKWDWTAYLDAALKLTKGTGVDKVYGAYAYPTSTGVYNPIHSNGGRVLTEDKSKCVITAPETVEAIQSQVDMLHKHKVSPLPAEDQVIGGHRPGFLSGRVAMIVDIITSGAIFKDITDFDWAIAPLPNSPRTGYMRTYYKPNCQSIPATAKNPDVAWQWLSYDPIGANRLEIDQGLNMTAFEENRQYFLDRCIVRNAEVVFEAFDSEQVFYLPLTIRWDEMNKAINDELTLARNGEKTVDEAVKAIEPQVNALLA